MGDIGADPREYEFEPLPESTPVEEPVVEPVPAEEPEREEVPA